jgi:hypothetical protein
MKRKTKEDTKELPMIGLVASKDAILKCHLISHSHTSQPR